MKNLLFYIILLLAAVFFEDPITTSVITLVILVTYLLGKVKSFKTGGVDPMTIYALFSLVTTLSNISLFWKYSKGLSLVAYSYYIPEYGQLSALIWAIGTAGTIIGFDIIKDRPSTKIVLIVRKKKIYTYLYLASIVLLLSKYFYRFNTLGSITDFFYLVPFLTIFFLARIGYRTGDVAVQNQAYVLTILATGLGVLYGILRFEFVIAILVFLLGAYLGGKKLSIFFNIRYLPVVLFIFLFTVFFEFFGERRSTMSRGVSRIDEFSYEAATAERNVEQEFSAFDRLAGVAQISNAVSIREQSEENAAESIAPLFTAMIPRFLWPEKPKIALGVWFAVKMGVGMEQGDWYNTSINMTIPGHAYLGFGMIGLIVCSILFGMFIGFLWTKIDYADVHNLAGGVLYGYLMYLALGGFGADLQIVVTMTAIYLLVLFTTTLFKTRNENTLRRPHMARQ